MQLKTRSVHIAGVTTSSNGVYMKQVARNLTDVSDDLQGYSEGVMNILLHEILNKKGNTND